MSVYFSKAPEGATHYSSVGCFYKMVDGAVLCAADDEGSTWFESDDYTGLDGLTTIPAFEPFTRVEDTTTTGSKHDSGKPLMGAVPPNALLAVAKVLTFGAEKYGRDNWRQVESAETRYMDAALRHINAYQRGEAADPESGESHLAHAVCSLMFMLELRGGE